MATGGTLENPILNSPYDPPAEHFVLGPQGPTGEVAVGRRRSESYIPVPVGRRARPGGRGRGRGGRAGTAPAPEADTVEQQGFDFDATGERIEVNRHGRECLRVRGDVARERSEPS